MVEMEVIYEDKPSQLFILSDGVSYQLKWDDSRLTTHIKEIKKEDYMAYLSGDRTGAELMHRASYGTWPVSREVQDVADKAFIRDTPIALITDSSSWSLFSQNELEKLIPLAEKAWIDWKGKLPDNYISPL